MGHISENIRKDLTALLEAGNIRTDSDIEDYAEEHSLSFRDVDDAVWEILSENTPCQGCKHVTFMSTGMYPCIACSRQAKDLYEPNS